MKKLVFLFVAFAAVSFASCGNKVLKKRPCVWRKTPLRFTLNARTFCVKRFDVLVQTHLRFFYCLSTLL